jgi:predicted permease
MSRLDAFRARLRLIVAPRAAESRADEEIRFHLEIEAERLVREEHLDRAEAERRARATFGGVTQHKETLRHTRWFDSVSADVRFAFRFFARKPLSSITIVLVLALGIAGYAAVFGLIESATVRPPPGVPDSVPLVRLRGMVRQHDQPRWSPMRFSYPALREMSELRTIFSAATAWTESDAFADMPGVLDQARTRVQFVTEGYFSVIGVRPAQGSALPAAGVDTPRESQLVAVISDAMWEDAFGRKDVMNRTVVVNGVGVRIVGVAPPEFTGVLPVDRPNRLLMWMALETRATILAGSTGTDGSSAGALSSVDSTLFEAVGRLQPGVSPQQATAAVRVVAMHAFSQMAPPRTAASRTAMPVALVYDADVARLRGWAVVGGGPLGLDPNAPIAGLLAFFGTLATLLLLVVCTNVAGLVVSAAVGRRQEIAVRLSLGASRARLIRQLLTENIVLALFGGALGLAAYWGVVVALSQIPEAAFFRPDLGTVAFTLCVALGTGILCGLAPALHATRTGVATALKDTNMGATRRSRLQHKFVVAQVMLTQPLLLFVGLIVGMLLTETKKPLPAGVADHVLKLSIDMESTPGSVAERRAALDRLLLRIRETPGVVSVLPRPENLGNATISVRAEDRGSVARAGDAVMTLMQVVTPGYFDLIGVPLVRGSDVVAASDTSRTIIIGTDLARRLWGDADPIGRRLMQISQAQTPARDMVVSGVYDSRYVDKGNSSTTFRPVTKMWAGAYLIRTAVPASDLAASLRGIAREELPSTAIASLATLAQIETEYMRNQRALQAGVAACGALVLLLSSIGLYGAVALSVGQRRREIGIRMALGARAGQVVALFYAGGVRLGISGLALGLPISVVGSYFLIDQGNSSSIDTTPDRALVGAVIALAVLVVASIATLIPATRAARVNPVTALRSE